MKYFEHNVPNYSRLERATAFYKPREFAASTYNHRMCYQDQSVLKEAERQYRWKTRDMEETIKPQHEIF
jgi:hypothetical protein